MKEKAWRISNSVRTRRHNNGARMTYDARGYPTSILFLLSGEKDAHVPATKGLGIFDEGRLFANYLDGPVAMTKVVARRLRPPRRKGLDTPVSKAVTYGSDKSSRSMTFSYHGQWSAGLYVTVNIQAEACSDVPEDMCRCQSCNRKHSERGCETHVGRWRL